MQIPLAIYFELLHRLVCVGPGGNLEYMFYYDAAYIMVFTVTSVVRSTFIELS